MHQNIKKKIQIFLSLPDHFQVYIVPNNINVVIYILLLIYISKLIRMGKLKEFLPSWNDRSLKIKIRLYFIKGCVYIKEILKTVTNK